MKNNLTTYEKNIPLDARHRSDLLANLVKRSHQRRIRNLWYLTPITLAFAVFIFIVRSPSSIPEVNAAELLHSAAEAFVTVPEGKILRIHRLMTGMIEHEDGRYEYGVISGDDVLFDGASYSWTIFDSQTPNGEASDMLTTSLAVLQKNEITYTKYEWIAAGCMESDGEKSCYDEQIVSYEMSDEDRHEAEVYRRAQERGISLNDSLAIKDIAGELACNEEINVYSIETDPLYEVLYAQSHLRQVRDYINGNTFCTNEEDCPVVRRETGEPIALFSALTFTKEGDLYRVTAPYNTEATAIITNDEYTHFQWEIWVNAQGLPVREELQKNNQVIQAVDYVFSYLDASTYGTLLTFDGWRENRGILQVPYNPSFAPWGYTKEQADYERLLRLTACQDGEIPMSRGGGTAASTIQLP